MNAHAEYVIANMRSAFATRGKTDVELAWRHANKFLMLRFADTFDDVVSTAVATGVLDSGTAVLRVARRPEDCTIKTCYSSCSNAKL